MPGELDWSHVWGPGPKHTSNGATTGLVRLFERMGYLDQVLAILANRSSPFHGDLGIEVRLPLKPGP